MLSDDKLIDQIKYGNERAAEELITRYYASILRYCRWHCSSVEKAEDLTQETFYKLFKNISGYKGKRKFKAYLYTIANRLCSFKVLVIEKLGLKAADDIDWTMPRVVCIAGDFTKYDESAIKQMNRNISLIRYKKFGDDLLMFEQINENIAAAISEDTSVSKPKSSDKTFEEQINGADKEIKVLYQNLSNYILSLGDDISETHLSLFYQ